MVTATQSTTVRTVPTSTGLILPAIIDQQTDFNLITTAISVDYRQSGCLGSLDTAYLVADAMRDSSAVVVLYVGLDGGQDAAGIVAEQHHVHEKQEDRVQGVLHDASHMEDLPH